MRAGGPYNEQGLDVLLTDEGDHYLAKTLTEKGEALLKAADWDAETDGEGLFESKKEAAEAKIVSSIKTDNLKDMDTLALHNASFWEDMSFACINCGTCTFLCPTCWCFDIQDEIHGKSGKTAEKLGTAACSHSSRCIPRDTIPGAPSCSGLGSDLCIN